MIQWLSTKQLADKLSVNESTIRRAIAAGRFKNTPLLIQQQKTSGRPTYVVAWDTDRNQPATEMQGEDHVNDNCAKQPSRRDENNSASPVFIPQSPAQPLRLSAELSTPCVQPTTDTSPSQSDTARTPTETPLQSMDGITPVALDDGFFVLPETGERVSLDDLIHKKVGNKPRDKARAQAHYYRKQYAQTGKIPPALLVSGEGRKLSGRRCELPADIQVRFLAMCENSMNPDSPEYRTTKLRSITNFHARLEAEFKRDIPINPLYTLLDRDLSMKNRLKTPEGETVIDKAPSFFKSEPVGSLIMMDGVTFDYIEIPNDKGSWYSPTLISLYDMGSRKYLAKRAYRSENNEDSTDILIRALTQNTFIAQKIVLRPDNAKAFLNLEKPLTELHKRYGTVNGLTLIFDAARVGTPKDKAHLESIHTKVHKRLEDALITHFQDRIAEKVKKNKVTGNKTEVVKVTRLNVSLDDINASGIVDKYTQEHNKISHRFTEDGKRNTKWIPNHRWDAAVKEAKQTHEFSIMDAALCRIYGYTKRDGVLSKDGTITYGGQKYFLPNTDSFHRSSQTSTKIRYTIISDTELAVFNANSVDGLLIGMAELLKETPKSDKLLMREKGKVDKANAMSELEQQISRLKDLGMKVDREAMNQLLKDGMTSDIFEQAINNPEVTSLCGLDAYKGTLNGFYLFKSTVQKALPQKEVKPFAAVK